jgi:transcriptional antiterminator RfaH
MTVADGRRWYVLQTKPRQEGRAEANLRSWGIETLAPRLCERRRSRGGEPSYCVAPLFPNYLFARFDAATHAAKVRLTRGVHRLIGFGECATAVDDAIVGLIKSRLGEDGLVRLPELTRGDRIEIVAGPLRSFVGVFERHLSARDRVIVLLTTLGCPMRVELAGTAIRSATRGAM